MQGSRCSIFTISTLLTSTPSKVDTTAYTITKSANRAGLSMVIHFPGCMSLFSFRLGTTLEASTTGLAHIHTCNTTYIAPLATNMPGYLPSKKNMDQQEGFL
jgi:hypothetical protein